MAEAALRAGGFALAALREGVMAIAADTAYATWTPQQFQEALDPAEVQALGLHVHMTRDASPHVLYRAREAVDMGGLADEEPDVLAERIRSGIARLAVVRAERPSPATVRIDAPAWHAETLRFLVEARTAGLPLEWAPLEAQLEALHEAPRHPLAGYERHGWFWLEDQVATSAAFLAAAREDPTWLEPAIEGAERILERYHDPESGALEDVPRGRGASRPSQDVVDGVVRAGVPAAVELFDTLAARLGRGRLAARFAHAADRIERYHRQAVHAASAMPAERR
jgi:uncharacterized protein YyaL (SSP411 family)